MADRRSSLPPPRRSADRRSCGRRIHGLLLMDGRQFTSSRFTSVLKEAGLQVAMDGRGRWLGDGFIERLWPVERPMRPTGQGTSRDRRPDHNQNRARSRNCR